MGRHLWAVLVVAAAALVASGCGDDTATKDAGPGQDAGPGTDGGPGMEGGPGMDAGPDHDAGPPPADPLDPSVAPTLDTDPSHYPANVWVTGPLEKVQPDATPGSDHWARLWAAKNEYESLQVHVKAMGSPVSMDVEVSDFTDAVSGHTIAAASNVRVFREAYLDVSTPSDANGVTGTIPDPLIPTVDPVLHEARDAFPTTVPAGETRSAWIDVLVPQDAPSGYYTANVTVRDGSTMLATLPVVLAVWDFAIPSTASLPTFFGMTWNGLCVQAYGGYSSCSDHPGSGGSNDQGVELTHVQTATMLLDYRVSADVIYAGPSGTDWSHFDSVYTPLLDGTADTELPGAKITSFLFTGDRTSTSEIQSWVEHFRAMGWLDRLFDYTCDEPPAGCSWSEVGTRASDVEAGSPDLPALVTTDIARATANGVADLIDRMTPVVDYMEPHGGPNHRTDYDAWLAADAHRSLWWYQSCDEHESCSNGTPGPAESTWPSYMVDASPVRNRVFQWLAFLDRIEGELYYDLDYCFTSTCGGGRDPWASLYAFGGNGDGTLVYPGLPSRIGGTTAIDLPSIRLAHIRDGMEDYELLHALDMAGERDFAVSTAHSFITDASTFDNDPAMLEAARRMLGNRLHTLALAP